MLYLSLMNSGTTPHAKHLQVVICPVVCSVICPVSRFLQHLVIAKAQASVGSAGTLGLVEAIFCESSARSSAFKSPRPGSRCSCCGILQHAAACCRIRCQIQVSMIEPRKSLGYDIPGLHHHDTRLQHPRPDSEETISNQHVRVLGMCRMVKENTQEVTLHCHLSQPFPESSCRCLCCIPPLGQIVG